MCICLDKQASKIYHTPAFTHTHSHTDAHHLYEQTLQEDVATLRQAIYRVSTSSREEDGFKAQVVQLSQEIAVLKADARQQHSLHHSRASASPPPRAERAESLKVHAHASPVMACVCGERDALCCMSEYAGQVCVPCMIIDKRSRACTCVCVCVCVFVQDTEDKLARAHEEIQRLSEQMAARDQALVQNQHKMGVLAEQVRCRALKESKQHS